MRIAHIIAAPFSTPSANGVSEMVRNLASAQSAAGARVAVFSSVDCGWTLMGDVLAWQPDIVHFHSVHVPQHVMMGARLRRNGIPYGVTVHGALFPAALRRGHLKKAAFGLFFERSYFNNARFIHALSADEADAIRRYGVECAIPIVPNGIPSDADLKPSQPDALYRTHPSLREQRIFMFIGRLDPCHKGLDLLIEAFARVAPRESALVLTGPDFRGSRRSLETLSARLGVQQQVIFTGPAFGDARANLLAAAHVFIHPSRWEGLSLSVLTAAAAGKPCVITRCADPLGELERANAAVIVDPTVPSIAAGLSRVSTLGVRALHAMGARARHVAETHATWPTIADRLMQAYLSALGPRHERRVGADEARMSAQHGPVSECVRAEDTRPLRSSPRHRSSTDR